MELCFALTLDDGNYYCSLQAWQASEHAVKGDFQMLKFLRARSRGLVEVKSFPAFDVSTNRQSEVPIVQFVHESVSDFLVRKGLQILDPSTAVNVCGFNHDRLARFCLNYLGLGLQELRHVALIKALRKAGNGYRLPQVDVDTAISQLTRVTVGEQDTEEAMLGLIQPEKLVESHSSGIISSGDGQDGKALHIYYPGDMMYDYPVLGYCVCFLFAHLSAAEKFGVSQGHLVQYISLHDTVLELWHQFYSLFRPASPYLEVGYSDFFANFCHQKS
jgi:hypothetical protein